MAVLNFTGFEAGSTAETNTVTGTGAFVSSGQRTGSYAWHANPTGTGTGYIRPGSAISATGVLSSSASISDCRSGFAFKAATLPASGEECIAYVGASGGQKCILRITSGGILKLYNQATSLLATGGTTLSANTWYYIEIRAANGTNAAYEVRVNGVSEFSGTGDLRAENTIAVLLGKIVDNSSQDVDFYYDDFYISDSGFVATSTALPEVHRLNPNAAGDSAGWTDGTGSTFAEVDEVPPESDGTDASYIQASATQDNLYSAFHTVNPTYSGTLVSIPAVKGFVWARTGSVSGSSTVALRVRSNTTNSDNTGLELLTSYQALHRLLETDPNGGGAWSSGGVDAVQIGMTAATIAQVQRFSTAYIMVLATVAVTTTVTIDSDLDKVTASLNVEQAGGNATVTVDSDLDEVSASLNAQQQYLLTIDSDLDKITAALNAVMLPTVTIQSAIDKVLASLNASHFNAVTVVSTLTKVGASLTLEQVYLATIDSDLDEVSSSLNVDIVNPPLVTIQSTLDKVSASLAAEQIYLATVDSDLDKVTASLEVVMQPAITIASTLDELAASLNLAIGLTDTQIVSTLREVAASLNVLMQPAVTIQSTLDEVLASLTLEQRQLLTIASTIDEVTASMAAQQIYLATIASVLDETSGSFNVSQLYLATVVAVLAEVQATLNAQQPYQVTLASTLREVQASLRIEAGEPISLTINALLAKLTAALTVEGPTHNRTIVHGPAHPLARRHSYTGSVPNWRIR